MAGGHEEDEAEHQPLLERSGSRPSTQASSASSDAPAASGGAGASSVRGADLKPAPSSDTICRICLEDDVPGALEAPCRCTGTQRYAHPACIQRWIDEKAAINPNPLQCEICKAPYSRPAGKGAYTAPPPPPPESPSADALPQLTPAERAALRRLLTRITLVGPPGAGVQAPSQFAAEETVELRPGVSWLLACFLMFLLLLNGGGDPSASPGAGPGGGGDAAGGGGSGSGGDPFSPSGPGADDDGSGAASRGLVLMLCLFAVWGLTKMCVFTGSLLAAAHGWRSVGDSDGEEGDVEAGYPARPVARGVPVLVATGSGSGSGGSSDALAGAGGAPDVELQRLGAGGRPHPVLVALHAISRHQRRQQRLRAQQQAGAAAAAGDGEAAGSTPGRLIAIV